MVRDEKYHMEDYGNGVHFFWLNDQGETSFLSRLSLFLQDNESEEISVITPVISKNSFFGGYIVITREKR